jgi:hypothetical protein
LVRHNLLFLNPTNFRVIPSFRRATLRLLCLKRFESKIANQSSSFTGRNQTDRRRKQVSNISVTMSPYTRGFGPSKT